MKTIHFLSGAVVGATILGTLLWSPASSADDTTVVAPVAVAQPVPAERATTSPPNVPLVTGGLIALGGAYIPSVIVAAANNNSYDHHLYIPVVGPWLDLANRPGCGGFGQTSCGAENGFKALLIVSGAFQGLGALATVVGLVTPEHRTFVTASADKADKKAPKLSLHITPAEVGRGAYGLAAFGSF